MFAHYRGIGQEGVGLFPSRPLPPPPLPAPCLPPPFSEQRTLRTRKHFIFFPPSLFSPIFLPSILPLLLSLLPSSSSSPSSRPFKSPLSSSHLPTPSYPVRPLLPSLYTQLNFQHIRTGKLKIVWGTTLWCYVGSSIIRVFVLQMATIQ